MASIVTAAQLRSELEAQWASMPDDEVTRCRQAAEDLLAEMTYVLAGHMVIDDELCNGEQDVTCSCE